MPELQKQKPSMVSLLPQSKVFNLDQLPMETMPNGGKRCYVVPGALVNGETVAVHQSTQPARTSAQPALQS